MKVYYNKAEQFINTYTKKRIVIVNIWENSASHSGNEPGINTFKRIEAQDGNAKKTKFLFSIGNKIRCVEES